MCGICGIVQWGSSTAPDPELVRRMNGLLVHRGPDDEGYYAGASCALGMRRLSIIDLSTGRQPISNEDGTVRIVFNGEVYNFQELRAELEGKGHRFKTRTDTETIVHLYEEMGPECVTRLRGMFAFAIWDEPRKRLVLARDRLGKKPLLYALRPGGLAFGSELRCLLEVPGISREVDPLAVDLYLALQYIPSPWTIFRDVRKLPPAHRLVWEKGKVRVERYWDLPVEDPPPKGLRVEEAEELLRLKLREAVRLRLIADVPLGAFLSGGIDSSIVVALMSDLQSRPVRTFSIGFEEEAFSELPYARELARAYGTDHHEFIVKPEMAEVLPRLAWHYGEPYADSSALPSYYVARETRAHVKVALNGDGGDESFAGYVRYGAMKASRLWDRLPPGLRSAGAGLAELLPEIGAAPYGFSWRLKRFLRSTLLSSLPERHLTMVGYFSREERERLYAPRMVEALGRDLGAPARYFEERFGRAGSQDLINRLLYVDFQSYLPECLMAKMDIASMAHSLEARSPFLDHEVVEAAYRLPGSWKLKGWRGHKWILKRAFRDKLPSRILRRGKMGFGVPLGPWFRTRLKTYWEERVLSPKALARGYFREDVLRGLWRDHQEGRRDLGFKLWALLMFELWHQVVLEGRPTEPPPKSP